MSSNASHNEQDKSMLEPFRQGENEALRYFHNKFWRNLMLFCWRLTGDKQAAEDIASETFMKLHRRRPDITSVGYLKSFLYTVARNACMDHLRWNNRDGNLKRELDYLNGERYVESSVIQSDMYERVYQQIERLPEDQRDVMIMLLYENKSYAEIAEIRQCNTQTVRNLRGRAINNLRKRLKDVEFILLMLTLMHLSANTGDEAQGPLYFNANEKSLKIFPSGPVKN